MEGVLSKGEKGKRQNHKLKVKILGLLIVAAALAGLTWFYLTNREVSASVQDSSTPTTTAASQLKWPEGKTVTASILMYHHIGPLPSDADNIRQGLTTSEDSFVSQLEYLKKNDYQVMTLAKMYELVALNKLPEKAVVLTFDDGYDDNYKYALPLLNKYNFHATFNILTGSIGKDEYMTKDQLKELVAAGNELGGHSISHPDLSKLGDEKLEKEVSESKKVLEQISGQPVISFCYPAGKFSEEVEKTVKSAGYKLAVTTELGGQFSTDRPFELPRYRMNPDTNIKKYLP